MASHMLAASAVALLAVHPGTSSGLKTLSGAGFKNIPTAIDPASIAGGSLDGQPADAMRDWEYWRRFAEHVLSEKKVLESEIQALKQNTEVMRNQNSKIKRSRDEYQDAIAELRARLEDADKEYERQLQQAELRHKQDDVELKDTAEKYERENQRLQAKYTRLAAQAKNLQLHLRYVETDREEAEAAALRLKEENTKLVEDFKTEHEGARQALKLEEDMASEIYQLKLAKTKLQAMYMDCRNKAMSRSERTQADAMRQVMDYEQRRADMPPPLPTGPPPTEAPPAAVEPPPAAAPYYPFPTPAAASPPPATPDGAVYSMPPAALPAGTFS